MVVSASAFAETRTATVPVSSNVVGDCSISGTSLAFGAYDRSNGTDGTASVTANCTLDLAATIELNDGQNTGRQMANGAYRLAYELYQDSTRLETWATDLNAVNISGTGAAETLTIFGRIPAGQNVAKGDYLDTVTATITFAP